MQKKYVGFFVAGLLLLVVIFSVSSYNSLVRKDEKVKQQWAEVQNTYQRRLDLVPNIVNTVKGSAEFEQGTLDQITKARANALAGQADEINGGNYDNQKKLQDTLAAATNRLIVVIEKYPTLQTTAAFKGLQTQLEGTERRIKVARKDFNAAVADYNTEVRSGGSQFFAKLFGFKVKEGFQADAGTDKSIEIKF